MLWCLTMTLALAGDTYWKAVSDPAGDWMSVRWTDARGGTHNLRAEWDPGVLEQAPTFTMDFPAIGEEVGARLRRWARDEGVDLTVAVSKDGKVGVRGPRSRLPEAVARREELRGEVLREHYLWKRPNGKTGFDAARVAADWAELVRPLARELGPLLEPRPLAVRALGLMQQIPYERADNSDFRTPLVLVRDREGDCDEKVALFAALLRALEPELPLAVFVVPGHAFVGLGIDAGAGEATVEADGRTWLVAEPVGPRVSPLGELSERTRQALAEGGPLVRVVPTGSGG